MNKHVAYSISALFTWACLKCYHNTSGWVASTNDLGSLKILDEIYTELMDQSGSEYSNKFKVNYRQTKDACI